MRNAVGMASELTIVSINIDGEVYTHVYKTIEDFTEEWADDDRCISIDDESICVVFKGIAYSPGYGTVEECFNSIPELDNIIHSAAQ